MREREKEREERLVMKKVKRKYLSNSTIFREDDKEKRVSSARVLFLFLISPGIPCEFGRAILV